MMEFLAVTWLGGRAAVAIGRGVRHCSRAGETAESGRKNCKLPPEMVKMKSGLTCDTCKSAEHLRVRGHHICLQ